MPLPPDDDATVPAAGGSGTVHFRTGDLILDRFRIVGLLGTGGMGEVYEAEDLTLRETIALKTIRLRHLRDVAMLDRLHKEVQLGRRVSHPNVCRLFDVFRVSMPPEPGGAPVNCAVVTMELLRGSTLAEHLRDNGRLTLAEALPLARQIGDGLEAAHAAGVVHRDLKSANIFVAHESGAVRAVITDFGLATSAGADEGRWDLSTTGAVMGTLAYMSPEQLRGEPATSASDIYAFGIVLYEMISGVLPFRASTPMAAVLKRVTEAPEDIRHHVRDISDPWRTTIHRCLALDPGQRFQHASDVVTALEEQHRERRTVRYTAAVVAVVAILAVTALYVRHLKTSVGELRQRQTAGSPLPDATRPRVAVAVFGFRNVSERAEFNYISTALGQGLGSELAIGEQLRIVSGEEVARIKRELGVAATDTLARDTLERVRNTLGADLVMLGSYTTLGAAGAGALRVDFRVQDTRKPDAVLAWSQSGTEAGLLTLISESGATARQRLGLGEAGSALKLRRDDGVTTDSAELGKAILAQLGLPTSGEARRLYAEGLDALRNFDAVTARDRLERAVAHEPSFAMSHLGLSEAWGVLGYDAQSVTEAAEATRLAHSLRHEQQLWIEAVYRQAKKEWPNAIESLRKLVAAYPDEPEYLLRLADAQTSGGFAKEALLTIASSRKRSTTAANDPRLFLAEASAAEVLGDARLQEKAARAAIEQAQLSGQRLFVARASISLGRALQLLGNAAAAVEANETGRRLSEEAGDRRGVARALIQLGDLGRESGQLQRAENVLTTALEISRSIGNKRQTTQALNNLANVYFERRRFDAAGKMYKEALEISREVGDKNAEAGALGNLASTEYEQGNVVRALQLDEQALAIWRSIDARRSMAFTLANMAETAADLGDLDRATRMYEESRQLTTALGDRGELSYALSGLAMVATRRDDLRTAERLLEEARVLRRAIGDADSEQQARVELAAVLLERGESARARDLLAGVNAEPGSARAGLLAAVLVSLAVRERRLPEAQSLMTTVRSDVQGDAGLRTGVLLDLAEAALRQAEGNSREAVRLAESVRTRMRARALQAFEMEAGLAVAEFKKDRKEALQLAAKAREAGFLLIARKAAAVAGG